MDEKNETPITEQPQAPTPEPTPEWNAPKPVEDELKKYSGGKGIKIFFVIALIVILAAVGLFLYKTYIGGITPSRQLQRQPATTETKQEVAPTTVTEETTVEKDIEEIENFNVEELDQIIEEIDLEDLNL